MAACEDNFTGWLSTNLLKLNPDVDLEVFVTYIRGLLEDDLPREEKMEEILGFMSQITDDDLDRHCEEIINKWEELSDKPDQKQDGASAVSLDEKMHNLIERTQQVNMVKTRELSAEERARKEAILQQYGQVADGSGSEGEEEEDDIPDKSSREAGAAAATGPSDADLLMKNMNALLVSQRERDQREKEKQDADKKKAKDKEDREKQKSKAAERKEAEKKRTQKGERRR